MPRAPAVYIPAPIPVYNWTGFYVGGNLGGSWQQGSFSDPFGNNISTNNQFIGTGGGQVGVNYEFNSGVVVGAEAMFDWRFNSGNTSSTVALVGAGGAPLGVQRFRNRQQPVANDGDRQTGLRLGSRAPLRQRRGAWVGSNNPAITINGVSNTFSTSNSNWGWTVGAGAEYAFWGMA